MAPKSVEPGLCAIAESNDIVDAKQAKSVSNKDRIEKTKWFEFEKSAVLIGSACSSRFCSPQRLDRSEAIQANDC